MSMIEHFSDYFVQTSASYSVGEWLSILAGLSLVTYVLIIFGGRKV